MLAVWFMRFLDKWMGIPLCFFLTPLQYLVPKRKNDSIAFILLAEMGATVLAYPVIEKAKKEYKKTMFVCFSSIASGVLAAKQLSKKDLIIIRDDNLFLFFIDTITFPFRCRVGTIVDLEFFSRYSVLLTFLSRAKKRAGLHRFYQEGLYRGNLYNYRTQFNQYIHTQQVYDLIYSSLTKGELTKIRVPSLVYPPTSYSKNISNIIVISPNSSSLLVQRNWPIKKWNELIKKLLNESDSTILLVGGNTDVKQSKKIVEGIYSPRLINLAGKTTIPELMNYISQAKVFVSSDSGPAHLATLTKTPIVVLFGPETPSRFSPVGKRVSVLYRSLACSPCVSPENQLRSPCKNNRCMKKIMVDEVLHEIRRVIK